MLKRSLKNSAALVAFLVVMKNSKIKVLSKIRRTFPFVGEVAAKLYLASGVTTIQTRGTAGLITENKAANTRINNSIFSA